MASLAVVSSLLEGLCDPSTRWVSNLHGASYAKKWNGGLRSSSPTCALEWVCCLATWQHNAGHAAACSEAKSDVLESVHIRSLPSPIRPMRLHAHTCVPSCARGCRSPTCLHACRHAPSSAEPSPNPSRLHARRYEPSCAFQIKPLEPSRSQARSSCGISGP